MYHYFRIGWSCLFSIYFFGWLASLYFEEKRTILRPHVFSTQRCRRLQDPAVRQVATEPSVLVFHATGATRPGGIWWILVLDVGWFLGTLATSQAKSGLLCTRRSGCVSSRPADGCGVAQNGFNGDVGSVGQGFKMGNFTIRYGWGTSWLSPGSVGT